MLAAPQQPPLDLVVTTLSNEIARLPGRFVLALDDYTARSWPTCSIWCRPR
jgi:hypothetical protein